MFVANLHSNFDYRTKIHPNQPRTLTSSFSSDIARGHQATTMARHITFVLYDQASPSTWKENRGKVASHIGKHYRNRSAPLRNSVAKDAKCQKSTSGATGR